MVRAAAYLTCLIALGIAWGTLRPPGPEGPQWILTDKHLHAGAFALLVLPLACVRPRLALRLAPLALIYGGLIEVIQPSFGRGAEWLDFVADGVGVAAGLAFGWILHRLGMGLRRG